MVLVFTIPSEQVVSVGLLSHKDTLSHFAFTTVPCKDGMSVLFPHHPHCTIPISSSHHSIQIEWKFWLRSCMPSYVCMTLCNPMECSLPDSSVYGILQARTQEWAAISSSRGSSWPSDRSNAFCIGRWSFTTEILEKPWSLTYIHCF